MSTNGSVEPLLKVENLVTRFDITSGLFGGITGRVHAVDMARWRWGPWGDDGEGARQVEGGTTHTHVALMATAEFSGERHTSVHTS